MSSNPFNDTLPFPLPDTTTGALAGPGQPILTQQVGMRYFASPTVPGGVAVDSTSLSPGKYLEGLTMDNIYRLLIKMINSLQSCTVVESNRLNIYTQWQNAYNAKLNGVHEFVQSNGDAFGVANNDSNDNNTRQELNNAQSTYTEQLRSNSGIVSDDAKAEQTDINQGQDAVNNASNMATSLVQQFGTMLSSIYQ